MNDTLQAQIDIYLTRLRELIRRGRELQPRLAAEPSDAFNITATRVWQQDVGVAVNELSGGSKAHWLARTFSEAFLLRSESGGVVDGALPDEIVQRLVEVLEQAVASLTQADHGAFLAGSPQPMPRRFDFVRNTELRPVLEKAYSDSRDSLEQGRCGESLRTACSVLEAIVTDALEAKGLAALVTVGAPAGKIADWSFQTRLTVAERAGLIRGGWSRLPEIAWSYRDQDTNAAITERDARQTVQVLHVVMRDLNPGR